MLSRKIDHTDDGEIREANKYYTVETSVALFVSFIINMYVQSPLSPDARLSACVATSLLLPL